MRGLARPVREVEIVNSAVARGVRDLVTDSKLPLIIANAGANAITGERRSDYVWRTSFTNGEVASALGAYVPGASWATARRS